MSSSFVPLSSLTAENQSFLSQVVSENTNPDGSLKDPNLLRRMENPICQGCHARYKEKYPGQPFAIKCSGVYDDRDYQEIHTQFRTENPGEEISLDEIREIYDVEFWGTRYILLKDLHGDLVPFSTTDRPYQYEALRCSATHIIDRWARGLGKTTIGVIQELHKVIINKKYEVLVVCPAQSQSEKWYEEIKAQVENSPMLRDCLEGSKKQPYYSFRFRNGSSINIFTAGSKSGRGADAVRGQSPRRVRLDEQDYLVEKDYQAIMPLVRRYTNSEFHGSSTPTGLRGMFWNMCVKMPAYREFYFPIHVDPRWDGLGGQLEQQLMREAKTMDRYRHEFLAEFGDPEQGLFKGIFVDQAKKPYRYDDLFWTPNREYYLGVDWNGKGTGTRLRVVAYEAATQKRICVAKKTVDDPGATMHMSMVAIQEMNRLWRCRDVFIDAGYGAMQAETLRKMGAASDDPLDRRLMDLTVVDFGGTLEFNKLVPKRDADRLRGSKFDRYLPKDEDKVERHTKPYMVDAAVQALEMGLIDISAQDDLLDEQMRAYRVKNYSVHGHPASFEAGDIGDHDLDAFMLALLAIDLRYGLTQTISHIQKMVQIVHSAGFGIPQVQSASIIEAPGDKREARKLMSGVPSRSGAKNVIDPAQDYRVQYMMRHGAIVAPVRGSSTSKSGIPSRTTPFRGAPPRRGPFDK
jgi:hypothetical protein